MRERCAVRGKRVVVREKKVGHEGKYQTSYGQSSTGESILPVFYALLSDH